MLLPITRTLTPRVASQAGGTAQKTGDSLHFQVVDRVCLFSRTMIAIASSVNPVVGEKTAVDGRSLAGTCKCRHGEAISRESVKDSNARVR